MNIKALLTLAAFLACCLFGMQWYRGVICDTCGTAPNTANAVVTPTETAELPPYYYTGKNGKDLGFSNSFPSFKDSVLANLAADEKLVVKGYWYAGEDTAGIGDLGMLRANRLKDTLSKFISPERISCISVYIDKVNDENVYRGALVEKALQPKLSNDSTTSVMANGKLIVYFPTNSTKNTFDSQTEKNIADIVNIANSTGKTIYISGHTDSQGMPDKNLVLSQNRANKLKDILVKRGVKAEQIKTEGKGQTDPLSDNGTANGRALNRRAEVIIQ
jgi:outer membrane protein OmpA-like peptidoglycan-associated protein